MSDTTGSPQQPEQPDSSGSQQPPSYPPPSGQPGSSGSQPPPPSYPPPSGQPDQPTAPYGQQPSPYGQPAYGQQSPYGQYGQPAYGEPGYGHPAYGAPGVPDKRPGTVTAAGVITIVFSSLTLLLFGFVFVGVLVAKDMMATELQEQPGFEDVTMDQVVGAVALIVGILAVWAIAAIVLAIFAMRRSNGARITLVVSSVIVALFMGLSIVGAQDAASAMIPLLVVVAAVTTIVCLFAGGASGWYAGKGGAVRHSGPVA